MTISTILLDINNRYVDDEGNLPNRTSWDKKWLAALVEKSTVSKEGFNMLPLGMQKTTSITHGEPELPITIPEINGLTDILIVIRSYIPLTKGKKFRLDNFELIGKSGQIELWKKKIL